MFVIISVTSLVLNFVNAVYVPPENVTSNKLSRAGIKTLGWQSSHYQQSPNIIVHHNYSKVILHQPDVQKIYNSTTYSRRIDTTPNTTTNTYQQTPIVNQNVHNSPNQQIVINNQLEEFATIEQENQNLNHNSLRNKLKLIREQVHNSDAEDSTINSRPFTNAHSGGYSRIKPEKMRLKILLNPQEIKSANEEIEVYKKCPSGATGQFVTELSCNQFLNCWKGRGYIQNCPAGTLFNPKTLECDFKHKVVCVSGPREAALTEKESLSEALQARCPQGFSGIIPHYTDCAKFINCNNGIEFVMDCAPGTLFDTKTNMCDYPYKVTCVGKEDEDDPAENKFLTIHGYKSNITYQIPAKNINDHLQELKYNQDNFGSRQGKYYKVGINDHMNQFEDLNSNGVLATTQHNQWFTQTAIYIGNISGTSKIDIGRQNQPHHGYPTTTPNESAPKCPAGESGLFPHPTICEKFLNCDHGRTFIQDCGPGTVFNPKFKVCDFPYNVDCATKTEASDLDQTGDGVEDDMNRNYRLVAGLNEAFSMGLTQSYCENKPGFWIYRHNCSRFIYCEDNQLFIGICSENLNFNPEKVDCEENVDCLWVLNQYAGGQQQVGPEVQVSPTEYWRANTQYQYFKLVNIGNEANVLGLDDNFCQINPGFSIHPNECSKFLLCTSKNKLLLGICNGNTYYNPQIKTCQATPKCDHIHQHTSENVGRENWQENTQYQYFRLVNARNEAYSLGLNHNFCQVNPGFSIHPRNCSKFLLCTSDGRLLLGICNANTYYSPNSKSCQSTPNCGHIQEQIQFGPTSNQQSGSVGREDWQVNTQYQYFRLISIGNEAYNLGLDRNFCQVNPGFSIHPRNCSKFLVCTSDGRLLLGICNANTYYNPDSKSCQNIPNCGHIQEQIQFGPTSNQQSGSVGREDWQVNTQYQYFRLISIGNEAYNLGLDRNFCQVNPGFSIHPRNCSKFLLCTSDGRLLLGICNANTYYNPNSKSCQSTPNCGHIQEQNQFGPTSNHQSGSFGRENWQANTQYQYFRLADIGNEAYNLGLTNNFCQNNLGFSRHPNDCSKFLLCTPNGFFLGICNANTFYNSLRRTCDSSSACEYSQKPPNQSINNNNQIWVVNQQYEDFRLREAGNEMNMLALDMYYCLNNEGFTTHPKNCSRFLLCQNRILFLGICNSHKYFNPSTKKCEVTYRCASESGGQNNLELPNQEGLQWQNQQFGIFVFKNDSSLNLGHDFCQANDGFNVHPVNCHQFLFCKLGRLYLGQCKFNMVYNRNLKTCDFITKCKQSKSALVGDIGISCDSKPNGLYKHPTICSKFINCQNGKVNIHDCASGTIFNPLAKNCDFPHNVNCDVEDDNQNNQNETEEERWQRYWNKQNPSQTINQQQEPWSQHQNQDNQWDQDEHQNCDWQDQVGGTPWDQDQNNQWGDQANQWDQWNQNQNNDQWHQDQLDNWIPTEAPAVKVVNLEGVISYDQNKKPTNQWPPPFPSTDPDADYVFELNDFVEPVVPDKAKDMKKVKNETCGDEDFHCTKTICIEYKKVCDGSMDCPDGEDEKDCDEYIDEFSYISSTQMAVKEEKRYENISISLCAKYCIESKGFVCKAFNFRKLDGICFLLATNVGLSGSLFVFPTYDYFEYEKYSVNCPKELRCPNQKCIEEHQVCDGIKDCVDRYDEKDCTAEELGYSVKLVGSQKSHEGAVQVTALGKTGYVCDDNFYMASAHILCKELGYHLGATEIKGNSYFTPDLRKNETFFIMDDIICNGNEASLKDCNFAGWGVSNCMEKEVLGIVCKTPEELCAAEMWQCESNDECIPMTFLCDNVEDCSDYSDEDPAYCEAPLEIRLVGGQTTTEGRVEIRHHATWGTICDDDFSDDAARVICKSLGFLGPARALKEAHFGPGSGPIWLDQVFCHGNETSLNDCIKWDWGVHNCEHSEDVSVVCNAYGNSESPRHAKTPDLSSEPILIRDRCGYRNDDIFLDNPDVHFRVVQGSKAKQGQYPWQASLRVKGPKSLSHWCGAVVISQKFVLTAAHCLHGFTKGAYIVVAGDYDVTTDEGSEQQVYIDEFYIHEQFRKGTKMNNDIALIRLKGNGFNITRDVQPICLPDADFTDEEGLNCTISGFGSVKSGRAVASKELRAGWIPIQPSEVCRMPHIYGNTITDGMICAGTLDGGVDACDGDSGGPLACLRNGLFTLVGMTSWGQHCGEANKPGVYVKIAHYRKWIDETVKKYDEVV